MGAWEELTEGQRDYELQQAAGFLFLSYFFLEKLRNKDVNQMLMPELAETLVTVVARYGVERGDQ